MPKFEKLSTRGAWYGGYWLALLGRNFHAGAGGGTVASVGGERCGVTVWLSPGAVACLVPRGMGWKKEVGLLLPPLEQHDNPVELHLHGVFSYDSPVVDSYHPRAGPPRGGFWVTMSGKNFGFIDTSPLAAAHGTACMESYWVSDSSILCRSQGGVGGRVGKRHDKRGAAVDVMFKQAPHVQVRGA